MRMNLCVLLGRNEGMNIVYDLVGKRAGYLALRTCTLMTILSNF